MADRFSDAVHRSFLNQTTFDLRKKNWDFLNRDLSVPETESFVGKKTNSCRSLLGL